MMKVWPQGKELGQRFKRFRNVAGLAREPRASRISPPHKSQYTERAQLKVEIYARRVRTVGNLFLDLILGGQQLGPW